MLRVQAFYLYNYFTPEELKKITLILIVLITHIGFANAQYVDTLTATQDTIQLEAFAYPKGVYLTVNDFISKKPTLVYETPYRVITQRLDALNGMDMGEVMLEPFNGMSKPKIRRRVFAFSTGKEVFINGFRTRKSKGFHKLVNTKGPLLYGTVINNDDLVAASMFGGLIGAAIASSGTYKFKPLVFNTKTKKLQAVSNSQMKTMLSAYPILKAAYDGEKPKTSEEKLARQLRYLDLMNAEANATTL